MALAQLKLEIEKQIAELSSIMAEIQRLDKYIMESEDPYTASTMVDIILERGDQFEQKTSEVRIALEHYLEQQKLQGRPLDFQYIKLLSQINKNPN